VDTGVFVGSVQRQRGALKDVGNMMWMWIVKRMESREKKRG
jgi:hypothetical protein